jgi:hypothetical protein
MLRLRLTLNSSASRCRDGGASIESGSSSGPIAARRQRRERLVVTVEKRLVVTVEKRLVATVEERLVASQPATTEKAARAQRRKAARGGQRREWLIITVEKHLVGGGWVVAVERTSCEGRELYF